MSYDTLPQLDQPQPIAVEESTAQQRIASLSDQLILTGAVAPDQITRFVDWGMHPDCPPEDALRIAQVLENRLIDFHTS